MRVGIMQPYFFPYVGYFQLLKAVDLWIAFDDVQFINKGWVNRNRILHPDPAKEWQYITLPLDQRGQRDRIREISIKKEIDWRSQILGKLTSYKRLSPCYQQVISLVRSCLDTDEINLARFVVDALKKTAGYLGIETPIQMQSDLDLELGPIEHPGQWALKISQKIGATEYVNPLSGKEIFRQEEFAEAGIKLSFLNPEVLEYSQGRASFIPRLSIIDVMMFNDQEQCARLLEGYALV